MSDLEVVQSTKEEKDKMKYEVSQAKKEIEAWKAHLLRFINRDKARLDALKHLDPCSVLLVMDCAMKYPQENIAKVKLIGLESEVFLGT